MISRYFRALRLDRSLKEDRQDLYIESSSRILTYINVSKAISFKRTGATMVQVFKSMVTLQNPET